MWIIILFRAIMDIFRSDDLSGWGKAQLRDRGVITAAEFEQQNAKLLAAPS